MDLPLNMHTFPFTTSKYRIAADWIYLYNKNSECAYESRIEHTGKLMPQDT